MDRTDPSPKRRDRAVDVALWVLTGLFAVATVWFSFVAPPPGVRLFSWADKLEHGIAYFATTLSFLFAGVWRPGRGEGRFPHLGPWILVGAVGVGAVIEWIQGRTPTRSAELGDVVAEAAGAGAALLVHMLVRTLSGPVRVSADDRP